MMMNKLPAVMWVQQRMAWLDSFSPAHWVKLHLLPIAGCLGVLIPGLMLLLAWVGFERIIWGGVLFVIGGALVGWLTPGIAQLEAASIMTIESEQPLPFPSEPLKVEHLPQSSKPKNVDHRGTNCLIVVILSWCTYIVLANLVFVQAVPADQWIWFVISTNFVNAMAVVCGAYLGSWLKRRLKMAMINS